MRSRRLLPLILAATLAIPVPALAADAPPTWDARPAAVGYEPVLGPITASMATLFAPVAMFGVAVTLQSPVVGVLVPLSIGTGHVLAGDPWRGAWVGAGSYGAAVVGYGAGIGWMALTRGAKAADPYEWIMGVLVAGAALAGYWAWASLDAGATSMREQIRQLETGSDADPRSVESAKARMTRPSSGP